MQRTALFLIASIVLSMGAAQAEERRDDRRDEPRRTKLECRFQGESIVKGKGVLHFCTALAHVCRFRDHDGFEGILADPPATTTDPSRRDDRRRDDRRCHDRMLIACDDHIIYEDGALRTSFLGYEFLSGVAGNPVIKFPDERDRFGDDDFDDRNGTRRSFVVPSWLKAGFGELPGICEVERIRDHRDDDGRH